VCWTGFRRGWRSKSTVRGCESGAGRARTLSPGDIEADLTAVDPRYIEAHIGNPATPNWQSSSGARIRTPSGYSSSPHA